MIQNSRNDSIPCEVKINDRNGVVLRTPAHCHSLCKPKTLLHNFVCVLIALRMVKHDECRNCDYFKCLQFRSETGVTDRNREGWTTSIAIWNKVCAAETNTCLQSISSVLHSQHHPRQSEAHSVPKRITKLLRIAYLISGRWLRPSPDANELN